MGKTIPPRPPCDWKKDERSPCRALATWQVRCAPRRADSGRGSWPGDINLVRACPEHLGTLTQGRRVLEPPAPLGDGGLWGRAVWPGIRRISGDDAA